MLHVIHPELMNPMSGLWNMSPWHNFCWLTPLGVGPTNQLKLCHLVPILKYCSQLVSATPENLICLCICIITCVFPYKGADNVLHRSIHQICCLWHTHNWKKCLICAWTHCRKRPACPGQLEAQLIYPGSWSVLLQRVNCSCRYFSLWSDHYPQL